MESIDRGEPKVKKAVETLIKQKVEKLKRIVVTVSQVSRGVL